MKKLLFAALAFAAVACSKSEVIEQTKPLAISFENPFVENTTKSVSDPSTTLSDLKAFTVYGFMDTPAGVVFNQEPVTLTSDGWKSQTTQYWALNHDYYFAALAGKNWSVNTADATTYGVGTVSFTNENGTDDLLYAATHSTTKGIDKITTENPGAVEFIFNHLLSKVKFAFTNTFTNPNTSIVVSNVTLTVPATGTLNLGEDKWWEGDKWNAAENHNLILKFGDIVTNSADENGDKVYPAAYYTENGQKVPAAESYKELLTIPTEYRTYTITFTAELFQGGVSAGKYNHVATVDGIRFEMGHAYKFTAELNGENINPDEALIPITFSVTSVKGWKNDVYDGGQIETNPANN
ncbi:MAG: fimbrillin family protein [Bacteroidales bacterium]|nr:fimbrillin family protein [Bacteroidales bacterium]